MPKKEFYILKFESAISTSQTWNIVKNLGVGKEVPVIKDDIDVNDLYIKFTALNVPETDHSLYVCPVLSNDCVNVFDFACVSQCDVLEAILKIKSNAVGLDDINPKFIKLLLPLILGYITYTINCAITTSPYPVQWKTGKIIPLPKSNGEFRPI